VVVFGSTVDDPKAIQGTTRGLAEKYGPERFLAPTFRRSDDRRGHRYGTGWLASHTYPHPYGFFMLAMNQLSCRGQKPLHVRRSGSCADGGALHDRQKLGPRSAAFARATFVFYACPGAESSRPYESYDAKGCLIQAIRDDDPSSMSSIASSTSKKESCRELYGISPGNASVLEEGRDVTLVGFPTCCWNVCERGVISKRWISMRR